MGGVRAAAALAMLVLCACGSTPLAQPAQTAGDAINVTGTVDRGPIATCPADEPCDPLPPAMAGALVFSREGAPPVTVRVASDGSFALHLDPGAYTIAAAPPVFHGGVEPSSVRVPDTGTLFVRLRIVRSP